MRAPYSLSENISHWLAIEQLANLNVKHVLGACLDVVDRPDQMTQQESLDLNGWRRVLLSMGLEHSIRDQVRMGHNGYKSHRASYPVTVAFTVLIFCISHPVGLPMLVLIVIMTAIKYPV